MIQLLCGDSRRVMKHRAETGQLADVIISDPPYGIGYKGPVHGRIANDLEPPLWSVPLMIAALKPGGTLVLFTSTKVESAWCNELQTTRRTDGGKCGWRVHRRIRWDKGQGPYGDEVILVARAGRPADSVLPETWSYPVVREHELKSLHDTPKPVALVQRLITEFTKPGDLVFDPFCGSCPTGVAATRLGDVDFVGVELESKYLLPGLGRISRAWAARDAVTRL